MVAISVQASGFEPIFAVLDRLERPHFQKLLTLIGLTIEEQTVRHFQEQAGPEGSWPPTKRGGAALVRTGTLRGSISSAVFPDEVHVGTNIFYGKYHQYGTTKVPARAFLGLTPADRDELQGIIENHIEDILGRL
jgi:phage gpG-like protein